MYITGVRNENFIVGKTYNDIVYPAVYVGEKAFQYEPYREQLLTLPTPNGLPGIPVTSGGNYTDPQGQQWVCDEVDLEREVKVQRIASFVIDAKNARYCGHKCAYCNATKNEQRCAARKMCILRSVAVGEECVG